MSKSDFRYTTSFKSVVRGSCLNCCDEFEVSQASLDKLKPLIPQSVDLEKNIDLVGVAFNAAVVNRFNRNGDGIDTSMAKSIKDYFINKPTNIEHNRNKVVGHIISSAFSSFDNSDLLYEEDVPQDEPFNIALGALVYRTVNPAFAGMLEQTKEGEAYHNLISASWELGFNDYHIVLGNDDLKLSEAEIITDEKQKEEFRQYLRAYEGDGVTSDGVPVRRLIVGEVFPLGIGFTSNPAAAVEGIYAHKQDTLEELVEKDAASTPEAESDFEGIQKEKKFTNSEKKCSLSSNLTVTQLNDNTMDTQNLIQEFEKVLTEKLGEKHSEEAVANMTTIINDSIKQKDQEYRAEKEAKEKLVETVEAQKAEFEKSISDMQEKLSQAETQLSELGEEKRQREAKELFNARMSSLEESFQLEEDDWKIVASELSELDAEEEAFATYLEKLNVVWKHKTIAYIEQQEKQFKEKVEEEIQKRLEEMTEAKASVEVPDVEEVLEDAEVEELEATNNSAEAAAEEPSLRDKFAEAFSKDNLTIKY